MSEISFELELAALPEDIRWRLQRADGFLDLRMPARARAELADIEAPYALGRLFRTLALRVASDLQDWREAAVLAEGLRREFPEQAGYWIQLAYAMRRAEGIEVARTILWSAQEKFPQEAIIPFNLACYECQLNRLDEARVHLRRAFELAPASQASALEDEDLRPLWPELD